jgi:peroxiredoxin
LELDALNKATEEFKALGANFIAISPQLQSFNREFTEEKKLTFEILSDPGNEVAKRRRRFLDTTPSHRTDHRWRWHHPTRGNQR